MSMENSSFSAAPSAIGYLYQGRFALLDSLRRLRKGKSFLVSIESLDDVVFESEGEAFELLQTKHHLNVQANLTDASPDLWKTIRIWCEGKKGGSIPDDSTFFLITTASANAGSIGSYLQSGASRDVQKAITRLGAVAESSTNKVNEPGYQAFRLLSPNQKLSLFGSVFIVDSAPLITDLEARIKEEIFYAVELKFQDAFLNRLEGWWLGRVIRQLSKIDSSSILSEELLAEMNRLREQFKEDNLPIDDDIVSATVDASGYQDKTFVHQLRLIEIGNQRIFYAIRNYFRAFEQRSRWIREDLILVGDLERYEDQLIEEWELLFEQMRDELGNEATERTKIQAAQTLYKWMETGSHPLIRSGCSEPFVSRGTFQILADMQRIGWHPEFLRRLKQILEPVGASL